MSFRVNTVFTNPALPSALPLSTQIKALSGFKAWWAGDARSVVLDGTIINAVSSWTDFNGSTATLSQVTGSRKGILTAGALNGMSGVVMDGADDFYVLPSASYIDFAADFGLSVAFTYGGANAAGNSGYIFASFNAVNVVTLIFVDTVGALRFSHGNGSINLGTLTAGQSYVVNVGKSGGTIRGQINGGTIVTSATNNAAGTVTPAIGSISGGAANWFKGTIYDVIPFTADKVLDGGIATLNQYFKRVYGVGV